MLALLSDLESFDPRCSINEKVTQLELLSNLLETENFLIEKFLEKNEERTTCLPPKSIKKSWKSRNIFHSASLQQKIDVADKMCMAFSDEVDQLEIKNADKLRLLNATKSELNLSCQEVSALRCSIEEKFQTKQKSIDGRCKQSDILSKFIENWLHNCKHNREKAHVKATALKRLCIREEQDVTIKLQVMKQVTPAEYVKLQFENKNYRKQLTEFRTQISKLRKEHANVLSRKIKENRKSIEIARMRRKILDEYKTMQATDKKLRNECDHLTETIAQMEQQIEDFQERTSLECPRITLNEYAKCKDKCEKLASVVKVVERKMGINKKAA